MPTWNHLWFLIYLWCYTALLILVLRWFPGFLLWGQAFLARVLQGPLLLVLPIALLWALRACLAARFPSTRALGDDWYNHAVYLSMFMAGTMLVQLGSNLFEAMQRLRWASLALAVLAWLALTNTQGMFAVVWRQGIFSVEHWCALVALIGFAHRHWQRDHPWRARLSEAVFPVYIFHQTFIVVLSQWFLPLKMQPKIEAPLLIASTLASSWIAYEMVRRWGVGRVWFGLGPCTQKRRHPSALLSA